MQGWGHCAGAGWWAGGRGAGRSGEDLRAGLEKKGRLPNLAQVGTAGSMVRITLEVPLKFPFRHNNSPRSR